MTTQITNHNIITDLNGIYSFLSDTYKTNILYDGLECRSVYDAYLIQHFAKEEDRKEITNISTEELEDYIANETYELRSQDELDTLLPHIAKELNAIKFSDPSLAKKLIETSDATIIYKTPEYDLGEILMDIRSQLKSRN